MCVCLIIVVDCGTPENITNGEMRVKRTVYKSVITYSCGYGYILIGVTNRTCQGNGLWSGRSPRCAGNIGRTHTVVGEHF